MIKMTQKNYEAIKIYNLKEKIFNLKGEIQSLKEENAQLKELLKDARNVLKMVDTYYGDYDSINGFLIVEKINQALGEDK